MTKAANMKALEALHAKVAEVLRDALDGEIDGEGNVRPPSPAIIDKVLRFLPDNGVEPAKDIDNSALDTLAAKVQKFRDGDDEALELPN